MSQPAAQKIMFIRHGEKPPVTDDDVNEDDASAIENPGPPFGVNPDGDQDGKSLNVRGWTRAGALIGLFAPPNGAFRPGIAAPTHIYASKVMHIKTETGKIGSKSKRPQQTVTPLEQHLSLEMDTTFTKGQELDLAASITAVDGIVLVCWEHKSIPKVLLGLPASSASRETFPKDWPSDDCFDIVWIFDLANDGSGYTFSAVQQMLLAGDKGVGAPAGP